MSWSEGCSALYAWTWRRALATSSRRVLRISPVTAGGGTALSQAQGWGQGSHGDPATVLTFIDGEECWRCGSEDGIMDVVPTGTDLCDDFQRADALWHHHVVLRSTAGTAGSVAQPGATSTPTQPASLTGW